MNNNNIYELLVVITKVIIAYLYNNIGKQYKNVLLQQYVTLLLLSKKYND